MLFRMITILAFALALTITASAATFTVNSTLDNYDKVPGDGVCNAGGGNCTLRAAFQEASALAGADVINLPAGTYTITQPANSLLPINFEAKGVITVNGAGPGATFVQAFTQSGIDGDYHILYVDPGANVTITGVTFRNAGLAVQAYTGGAIHVEQATLTLNSCIVRDNLLGSHLGYNSTGHDIAGAGIYVNAGTLALNGSVVTNNKIQSWGTADPAHGGKGAGIFAANSTVTLYNSLITDNQITDSVVSPESGAGIALQGTVNFSASASMVSGNSFTVPSGSTAYGAGIWAFATTGASTFNLSSSNVSGNTISGGTSNVGGGIYLVTWGPGTIASTIDKSTIGGNQLGGIGSYGGGMFIGAYVGAINQTMTNSTVSGNYTSGYGGGIFIRNDGSNSTTGTGTLNYTNDTISGNDSYQDGGGIYFSKWNSLANPFQLNLNFVTVANNYANLDNSGTNGGGGIVADWGPVNLKNSVIANNVTLGGFYGYDLRGGFYSQGYNHIGVADSFFTLTNSTGTDSWGNPMLGNLQNNSGPTYTHLPSFGPLVDQIPRGVNGCGTTVTSDQRGFGRPAYNLCDKGSVEWWYLN